MLMRPDLRTQQRDFLLGITRAITAQLDLGEVLRRVLHASLVMLAGRVGIVALSNKTDGRFYVRASSGIAADAVPELNIRLQELMEPGDAEGFSREFLNKKLREMADAIDSELAQFIAMPLVFAQNPLGLLIVFPLLPDRHHARRLDDAAKLRRPSRHRREQRPALRRHTARTSAPGSLLNSSGDGVLILDPGLLIQRANDSFARMSGWGKDDLIHLPKQEVIVWDRRDGPDLEEAMASGWPRPAAADKHRRHALHRGRHDPARRPVAWHRHHVRAVAE